MDDNRQMWKFLKIISSVLIGIFVICVVIHIAVSEATAAMTVAEALVASWLFLLSLGVFNVVSMLVFAAITKLE